MKNLQTKVHALDQEQTRQQELIYSAEFQIQQMERKVARGMGERTDEEKSQLTSKIRELEVGIRVNVRKNFFFFCVLSPLMREREAYGCGDVR